MKVLSRLPTQQQPAASSPQSAASSGTLSCHRHLSHCPSSASALPCPALPFVIIHLFYFVAKPFASHAVCKGCSIAHCRTPSTVFVSLASRPIHIACCIRPVVYSFVLPAIFSWLSRNASGSRVHTTYLLHVPHCTAHPLVLSSLRDLTLPTLPPSTHYMCWMLELVLPCYLRMRVFVRAGRAQTVLPPSSTISVDHPVIHSSNLRYGTLAFFSSP